MTSPSASPPVNSSAPFSTASSISSVTRSSAARVDQRADLGRRVARIADLQRSRARGELCGELVGDATVDDDALGRHADLALVHERAEVGGRRRGVEVGVLQHHERRLAAELEQHALEMAAGLLGDDRADVARAGEVDAAHGRMCDQLVHHLGGVGRVVGDQVRDACGNAGLLEALDDRALRARRQLRGLHHDRVAVGKRRGDRARAEDHGRVPGSDADDHAGRLAHRPHALAGDVRADLLVMHGGGVDARLAQHARSRARR